MKRYKNALVMLATVVAFVLGAAAPVSASVVQPNTACKVYTNPAEVSFNADWQTENGSVYPMGFTGTLTTGDSTSGCSDINISNVSPCQYGYWLVSVQYLSGGVWHTTTHGNDGVTTVPCNSSALTVIASNFANNVSFRVLIDVTADNMHHQGFSWPTFKLYV